MSTCVKCPPLLRSKRIAGLVGLLLSPLVQADFSIPGFELVHTSPVDTSLETPDIRQTALVWIKLFDGATKHIDISQFYLASHPNSQMEKVLEHLEGAAKRGVKIRVLMEEKGLNMSEPTTLTRLQSIPNLTFRVLPYARVSGGIIHAKYIVIDKKQAFVGSQNFDWRALEHIHETGLRITDKTVVSQIQAVFEQDWQIQAALAENRTLPMPQQASAPTRNGNYLVASPQRYNPPGVGDSQQELPRLLAEAKHEIRVQLLDYAPLSYGPDRTRPYYAVIDNAVRAAAARGVSVKLMVSNWNTDKLELPYLKSLAVLPNIQIKIVTLPQASQGFIPYARVTHSKFMAIDDQVAWIGTSNWLGGYLDNSRNLEIVMRNSTMAKRVGELHTQLWDGPYAKKLDVMADYPAPHPDKP